jgi:hypothetical protein
MKKLFEKDIVRFTFVLTVVSLACGLLIGGVNAITAPIIEQNQLDAKLEAYESVLPGIESFTELETSGDPDTIQDKIEGKDALDAVMGYIFVASANNKYGSMTMVVSVDATGLILGATFSSIEQTYLVDTTRDNLALFIGTSIMDLSPMGDIATGATGSFHTLEDLLADIKASFETLDIPEPVLSEDPYAVMFDESLGFAYSEEDTTFTPSSDLIIGDLIGALDGDTDVISGATNTFDVISSLLNALAAEVTS